MCPCVYVSKYLRLCFKLSPFFLNCDSVLTRYRMHGIIICSDLGTAPIFRKLNFILFNETLFRLFLVVVNFSLSLEDFIIL